MSDKEITPNPGSPQAVELGCLCPVMDNNHGDGFLCDGQEAFYYNEYCALHGHEKE